MAWWKSYLATKIVKLMPPHVHYVEPYAGGLSVLFAKDPEGVSEVVNDINGDLTNFWRVLQENESFAEFKRLCEATPFSQVEWRLSNESSAIETSVVRAWKFFVRCRQSMAGRMDTFAPLSKNRTRRGMNEQASAWLNAIEGLPEVHKRLSRVVVLNDDATNIIKREDSSKTCLYVDSPYLHTTRVSTSDYGEFEMSLEQHEELLRVLSKVDGKFLLSGYQSDLYNEFANKNGWKRHEFEIANHASSQKTKPRMTECLWTNFTSAIS